MASVVGIDFGNLGSKVGYRDLSKTRRDRTSGKRVPEKPYSFGRLALQGKKELISFLMSHLNEQPRRSSRPPFGAD